MTKAKEMLIMLYVSHILTIYVIENCSQIRESTMYKITHKLVTVSIKI